MKEERIERSSMRSFLWGAKVGGEL